MDSEAAHSVDSTRHEDLGLLTAPVVNHKSFKQPARRTSEVIRNLIRAFLTLLELQWVTSKPLFSSISVDNNITLDFA